MNQTQFYKAKLAFETDSWDLHQSIENSEDLIVIDARSESAYATEHIPNAINISHRTMTLESTKHLSKKSLIVVYCDGIGCNASTKGALIMTQLGFNVKELMGGIDWWKRDGYKTSLTKNNDENRVSCGC